jgi:uncharacterized membrane protein
MVSNSRYFLDIPTRKGWVVAISVIVGSMILAGVLYGLADKGPKDYLQKIGDSCIQGAIGAILFAILKQIIDSQKAADEKKRQLEQQQREQQQPG